MQSITKTTTEVKPCECTIRLIADAKRQTDGPMERRYTPKQGQYLAFIYYYTKIHGRSPAEADIRSYFKVSPPAVHQMILTLEIQGFIGRTPGQPRSIRLLLGRDHLPDLD